MSDSSSFLAVTGETRRPDWGGRRGFAGWLLAAVLLELLFLVLALASTRFQYGRLHAERPIVEVVELLRLASLIHGALALLVWRFRPPLSFVLGVSVAFRLTLLPSGPIQEDDFYRYIWDGKVVACGLDPYRFSPDEIRQFEDGKASPDLDMAETAALVRLGDLRRSTRSNRSIFERINNSHLATIYPLTGQGVFALAALLTADDWPIHRQIVVMKAVITVFDFGALLILILILRATKLPAALALIYGWCPLVIKEFAGTGHVDAVGIFFLLLTIYFALRGRWFVVACAFTAVVLVKFYAIVLLPLVLILLARAKRETSGFRLAQCWGAAVLSVLGVGLASQCVYPESREVRAEVVRTFAEQWENHDAIFLWIRKLLETVASADESIVMTRITVGILFLLVLAYQVWRRYSERDSDPACESRRILGSIFSVLISLLLLCPVGFPWYFLVCVPFFPFARRRCWYFLPGFLTTYYLFFWFLYREETLKNVGTDVEYYHDIVVSWEFGLFFALWVFEGLVFHRASGCAVASGSGLKEAENPESQDPARSSS